MAKPKIQHQVVITQEACKILKEDIISSFLSDGNCFDCIAIDPSGVYLTMKIEADFRKKKRVVEIAIPHYFVLYIMSADSRIFPGFGNG